jgi:hypothetical protein
VSSFELSALVDREANTAGQAMLSRHVGTCARCAERLAAMRAGRKLYRDLAVCTLPESLLFAGAAGSQFSLATPGVTTQASLLVERAAASGPVWAMMAGVGTKVAAVVLALTATASVISHGAPGPEPLSVELPRMEVTVPSTSSLATLKNTPGSFVVEADATSIAGLRLPEASDASGEPGIAVAMSGAKGAPSSAAALPGTGLATHPAATAGSAGADRIEESRPPVQSTVNPALVPAIEQAVPGGLLPAILDETGAPAVPGSIGGESGGSPPPGPGGSGQGGDPPGAGNGGASGNGNGGKSNKGVGPPHVPPGLADGKGQGAGSGSAGQPATAPEPSAVPPQAAAQATAAAHEAPGHARKEEARSPGSDGTPGNAPDGGRGKGGGHAPDSAPTSVPGHAGDAAGDPGRALGVKNQR